MIKEIENKYKTGQKQDPEYETKVKEVADDIVKKKYDKKVKKVSPFVFQLYVNSSLPRDSKIKYEDMTPEERLERYRKHRNIPDDVEIVVSDE